jgi:hypothetical protein
MKIGEWSWNALPDMKEMRRGIGVYASENRIYLIGGINNTTREYYDIQLNSFNLLPSTQVITGSKVCSLTNDKIYVLGSNNLRVLSKEFQLLQSQDNMQHSPLN